MTNQVPMPNAQESPPSPRSFGIRPVLAAGGALVALAGCTVGPNYHPPQVDLPAQWVSTPGGPGAVSAATRPSATTMMTSSSRPSTPTHEPAEVVRWWRTFDDPVLDSLVDRALESNLDLLQATSRIREARASRRGAAAAASPAPAVPRPHRPR